MTMQMFPVTSSNLKSVGYNPITKILRIIFHNGVYDYFEVPNFIYKGLMNENSKGQYYHRYIKGLYRCLIYPC